MKGFQKNNQSDLKSTPLQQEIAPCLVASRRWEQRLHSESSFTLYTPTVLLLLSCGSPGTARAAVGGSKHPWNRPQPPEGFRAPDSIAGGGGMGTSEASPEMLPSPRWSGLGQDLLPYRSGGSTRDWDGRSWNTPVTQANMRWCSC